MFAVLVSARAVHWESLRTTRFSETYTSMRALTFGILSGTLLGCVVCFQDVLRFLEVSWYHSRMISQTQFCFFEAIPSWRLTFKVSIFLFRKIISHIPFFDQESCWTPGLAAKPCCAFSGHV